MNTDTPRTDAEIEMRGVITSDTMAWNFARQLERELNEAKQRLAQSEATNKELKESLERCKWAAKVADNEKKARLEAEAANAAMREALESYDRLIIAIVSYEETGFGWKEVKDQIFLGSPLLRKVLSTDAGKELLERLNMLETQLRIIGDKAVVDWDDATVGEVDKVITTPCPKTYGEFVRQLYEFPKQLSTLKSAATEVVEAVYVTEKIHGINNSLREAVTKLKGLIE